MISKLLAWIDRVIGPPPGRSTLRQVYVVDNQDFLATPSDMSDDEAYAAVVGIYELGPHESGEEER